MNYLLTVILLGLVSSIPMPNCTVSPFWQQLPLTPFEKYRLNLDDLVKGYNLQYSLENATDFPYVKLQEKLTINNEQTPVTSLNGLKNYHLDLAGNSWGNGFIALTEVGSRTTIHYGLLASNTSAPAINNTVEVQREASIRCFDAVLFPAQDLVIVDCMLKLDKPKDGKKFQNRFVYVHINSGSILPTHVDTQMYIAYDEVTRRRLHLYTDPETGYHYLLRSYFADGVSKQHSLNTYIDVFIINDPLKPWTLKVIDRSLLHQSELSIMDVQMYLGDIYMLDNRKGLYRMDITVHQQIVITGRYEANGFTRFGVYSNNLDDAFEIALANSHSVYQIDWSRPASPILITKYSLLPNSHIEQLAINEDYVVVQSYTLTNSSGLLTTYNYTWIFNRGDRTYSKAFQVINHDTVKTFIQLHRQKSYLMVLDDQALTNYAIKQPILTLNPQNEDQKKLNVPWNFTLKALSSDPISGEKKQCRIVINFTLVQANNKTMWPSGYTPPDIYSANYPGRLEIPIYEYILGPNITYEVKPTGSGPEPDKYQVLQQHQLNIHWEHSPGMIATRFLKTEQVGRFGNDTIVLYLQDLLNITYIAICRTEETSLNMYCDDTMTEDLGGQLQFLATTYFMSSHTLKRHHVMAYLTNGHGNMIHLVDLTERRRLAEISFPDGYAGNVSSLELTANYLFIVQPFIKTVLVYDLNKCFGQTCQPIYKIDVFLMAKLGVNYFNPKEVLTSTFHPEVIFIKTPASVIILDVDKEGHPKLLYEIISEATKKHDTPFKVGINFDYLIIANSPGMIEEYALDNLYKGEVIYMKNYPLYEAKLPVNFDLDVSDQGDTIYVTVIGGDGLQDVFVYRAGYPNVGSLYDVVPLGSYRDMLVDVTGSPVDYVTVVSGNFIRVFKQFELPLVLIQNAFVDYTFQIEYYNVDRERNLTKIKVLVQNWPTDVLIRDKYKDIMNTKDILYSGKDRLTQFNEEGWYSGNVLTIKASCRNCGDKVIVKGHFHEERDVLATSGMREYQWGFDGGSIQQTANLIHMKHNGSIDQIVALPQASWDEICLRVAVPLRGNYHVSACQSSKGINLYVTSFISSKGFSWGPEPTGATHCSRLEVVRQLIMLVDTDPLTRQFRNPGGVYIYAINTEASEDELITELDYLNTDDFGGVAGWDDSQTAYINNAQMTYTPEIDTYRLIMTENRGIFVLDFSYANGQDQITVKRVNFLDLNKHLTAAGYHMPYDASYQAVTVMHSHYDRVTQMENQSILVTTGRFHTFQFEIITNRAGDVVHFQLIRVYLRYAFYHVNNQIRHFNDYFVVSQVIPDEWAVWQPLSRQILTVYHTNGAFNGTVEKRQLRGAYILNDRHQHSFDFNWTFNAGRDDDRMGMILIDPFSDKVKELSIYKNLQIITKQQLQTQILHLELRNDFSKDTLRLYMHGTSTYPEWKIVLIVVFSIIGLAILAVVGLAAFRFVKARREGGQYQESLMSDG